MSTTSRLQRRRLDDILVDEGLVSRDHVNEALGIQGTTGETLGEILVDMGCLTGQDISKVICLHYQLPFINLDSYDVDTKLLGLFPPEFLHQHKIIPFDCIGEMLLCAVTEIPSGKILSEIPRITKRKVALYTAYLDGITKHLQEHCPLPEDSELLKLRRTAKPTPQEVPEDADGEETVFAEQGAGNLMDALDSTWDSIFQAVKQNQSDPDDEE